MEKTYPEIDYRYDIDLFYIVFCPRGVLQHVSSTMSHLCRTARFHLLRTVLSYKPDMGAARRPGAKPAVEGRRSKHTEHRNLRLHGLTTVTEPTKHVILSYPLGGATCGALALALSASMDFATAGGPFGPAVVGNTSGLRPFRRVKCGVTCGLRHGLVQSLGVTVNVNHPIFDLKWSPI